MLTTNLISSEMGNCVHDTLTQSSEDDYDGESEGGSIPLTKETAEIGNQWRYAFVTSLQNQRSKPANRVRW